jgi:hypothetical protein
MRVRDQAPSLKKARIVPIEVIFLSLVLAIVTLHFDMPIVLTA